MNCDNDVSSKCEYHLDEQLSFDRPDLPTFEAEEFGIEGRRRGRRILLKAIYNAFMQIKSLKESERVFSCTEK